MRIGLRKMFIFNTSRKYETFFHMRKNLIYPMMNKKEIVITYRYKHKFQEKLLICGHVWEERWYYIPLENTYKHAHKTTIIYS